MQQWLCALVRIVQFVYCSHDVNWFKWCVDSFVNFIYACSRKFQFKIFALLNWIAFLLFWFEDIIIIIQLTISWCHSYSMRCCDLHRKFEQASKLKIILFHNCFRICSTQSPIKISNKLLGNYLIRVVFEMKTISIVAKSVLSIYMIL